MSSTSSSNSNGQDKIINYKYYYDNDAMIAAWRNRYGKVNGTPVTSPTNSLLGTKVAHFIYKEGANDPWSENNLTCAYANGVDSIILGLATDAKNVPEYTDNSNSSTSTPVKFGVVQQLLQKEKDSRTNNSNRSTKKLILPININKNHWVTLVVLPDGTDIKKATYRYIDSLSPHKDAPTELKAVIQKVYEEAANVVLNDQQKETKRQNNGHDCGLYVLEDMAKIISASIKTSLETLSEDKIKEYRDSDAPKIAVHSSKVYVSSKPGAEPEKTIEERINEIAINETKKLSEKIQAISKIFVENYRKHESKIFSNHIGDDFEQTRLNAGNHNTNARMFEKTIDNLKKNTNWSKIDCDEFNAIGDAIREFKDEIYKLTKIKFEESAVKHAIKNDSYNEALWNKRKGWALYAIAVAGVIAEGVVTLALKVNPENKQFQAISEFIATTAKAFLVGGAVYAGHTLTTSGRTIRENKNSEAVKNAKNEHEVLLNKILNSNKIANENENKETSTLLTDVDVERLRTLINVRGGENNV